MSDQPTIAESFARDSLTSPLVARGLEARSKSMAGEILAFRRRVRNMPKARQSNILRQVVQRHHQTTTARKVKQAPNPRRKVRLQHP